ncbi:dTDP-4-dehydrorhamnose 3,5-epimerase [Neptunomonas sp.]|uniref:dTDP-4-dehydrorhamnose 3,5-epimerase n=1 Tax=Neptunomonas sp. TaxID=1971898 RepID=UPI003566EABB
MQYQPLSIPDVVLITPKVFGDERGFFMETFRDDDFRSHCADVNFVQDNHSTSHQGILRGMHYQTQHTQGKLLRVISGVVFDVAVDMRRDSSSFGEWVGVHLSSENKEMLWVPPGFAHGFYVVSDTAEFVYKCTDYYAPEYEVQLRWDDPTVAIQWPLINGELPQLSVKDAQGLTLAKAPTYE